MNYLEKEKLSDEDDHASTYQSFFLLLMMTALNFLL